MINSGNFIGRNGDGKFNKILNCSYPDVICPIKVIIMVNGFVSECHFKKLFFEPNKKKINNNRIMARKMLKTSLDQRMRYEF